MHKTEDRDAVGIAEAATRPAMSFDAVKSAEQLNLQAVHRSRERLIHNPMRLISQTRGILTERGIRIGQGRRMFRRALKSIIAAGDDDLGSRIVILIHHAAAQLADLNRRINDLDAEIKVLAQRDPDMRMRTEVPGLGPMIAKALVAAVSDGWIFTKGRDLFAWLRLVPR